SNAVNYIDPLGLERKYDNCVARCEEVLGDTGGMGGKCWTKCSIRSEAEACSVASNHGMRLCLIGCNLSSDANDPRPAREFRKAMDKALKRCSCSSSGIPLIVLVLFLMLIVIKEKRTV
ncbi:hypothetical protein KAR91_28010, partial [Candidatus Pacearchaeota archaeon]|nr:hypothetical protein [Candidatus Pacearchaeota archaeon]